MNVAVTSWGRVNDRAESICYAIDLDSIVNGRANIEPCVVADEEMARASIIVTPGENAFERLAKMRLSQAVEKLVQRRTQKMNRARRRQDAREAAKTETVV